MVRLESSRLLKSYRKVNQFQFLNGAIRIKEGDISGTTSFLFQFLNGAIRIIAAMAEINPFKIFQFLNGAIRISITILNDVSSQVYFNS